MRRPSFIALTVVLVVLVAGASAVYAYDASRSDTIAEGVTAGGVELGGMSSAQARAALKREVARPLRRSVRVRFGGQSFRLTPRKARLRTDVDGVVREALARSREGNLVSRTARDLSGESLEVALDPRISYSRRAVARLVDRVKDEFDRAPQEPSLSFSGSQLEIERGRNGRRISARRLRRQIAGELVIPGSRTVRPRPKIVRTSNSRAALRRRYPTVLAVDRDDFKLRYYRNLKLVETYPIAVGQAGLETPAGRYDIQNKAIDPAWQVPKKKWAGRLAGKTIPGGRSDNPLKARWMGFHDGAGIHGTDEVSSLGTRASHGCVRMAIPDVKELYDRVDVGAPVFVS